MLFRRQIYPGKDRFTYLGGDETILAEDIRFSDDEAVPYHSERAVWDPASHRHRHRHGVSNNTSPVVTFGITMPRIAILPYGMI